MENKNYICKIRLPNQIIMQLLLFLMLEYLFQTSATSAIISGLVSVPLKSLIILFP